MKKLLSVFFIITLIVLCAMPTYAVENDGYISIDRDAKHLGSRLHKEYKGYIYKITNLSDQDIIVDGISLTDTVTGKVAYSTLDRSSLATGAKTIGTGLLYAIPTLTISLIGSIIVAPIKMVANTCGNIGAKQDSKRYDKPYNEDVIKASSTVEIKTLAPKHTTPKITILYHLQDKAEIQKISY